MKQLAAALILALLATAPALAGQGYAVEVLETPNYVYVRAAAIADGEVWLAAPTATITPGASLRWGEGSLMRDFFAIRLGRVFPAVLFVPKIETGQP